LLIAAFPPAIARPGIDACNNSAPTSSIRLPAPSISPLNDVISEALDTFDGIQDIAGEKINIFEKGSNKALGQLMRRLMSNAQSRVPLENALDAIDATATKFGGRFDDDVRDLASFARGIEDRFGSVAKTSFKGEIEGAGRRIEDVGAELLQASIPGLAIAGGKAAISKARGVNDFNAFRAMEDLIKRGQTKRTAQRSTEIAVGQ